VESKDLSLDVRFDLGGSCAFAACIIEHIALGECIAKRHAWGFQIIVSIVGAVAQGLFVADEGFFLVQENFISIEARRPYSSH